MDSSVCWNTSILLAPLNQVKLLPIGGVAKDNLRSFFGVGAIGAGMGSSLLNKSLIQSGDFQGLVAHFKDILAEIDDYRQV